GDHHQLGALALAVAFERAEEPRMRRRRVLCPRDEQPARAAELAAEHRPLVRLARVAALVAVRLRWVGCLIADGASAGAHVAAGALPPLLTSGRAGALRHEVLAALRAEVSLRSHDGSLTVLTYRQTTAGLLHAENAPRAWVALEAQLVLRRWLRSVLGGG